MCLLRKLGTPTMPLLLLPTLRFPSSWLVCRSGFYSKVMQESCIFLKSHFLKEDDCLAKEENNWLALVVVVGRHSHMSLGGYDS